MSHPAKYVNIHFAKQGPDQFIFTVINKSHSEVGKLTAVDKLICVTRFRARPAESAGRFHMQVYNCQL